MSQKMRRASNRRGKTSQSPWDFQSSAGLGKAVSEAWWGWISGIVGGEKRDSEILPGKEMRENRAVGALGQAYSMPPPSTQGLSTVQPTACPAALFCPLHTFHLSRTALLNPARGSATTSREAQLPGRSQALASP